MSSDSGSPMLVDDSNVAVQYAPGWIWEQLVQEVMHTRHGAPLEGLTASLAFAGTGIQVVGTLAPSSDSGQPTAQFAIDDAVVGTYTAPFTPSTQSIYNVTFFSKRDLFDGNHKLVVTNMNGTKPNVFWLDYFLIDLAPLSGGTQSLTQGPSLPLTSSSSDSPGPTHTMSATGVSSDPASNTTIPAGAGSSQATHHSQTGAIVGGVIGGVGSVLLLAFLFLFLLPRRRQQRIHESPRPYLPSTGQTFTYSPTTITPAAQSGASSKNINTVSILSALASRPPTEVGYRTPNQSEIASTHMSRSDDISRVTVVIGNSSSSSDSESGHRVVAPGASSPQASVNTKLQELIYGPSPNRSANRPDVQQPEPNPFQTLNHAVVGNSPVPSATLSSSPLNAVTPGLGPSPASTAMPTMSPTAELIVDREALRAPWYAPAGLQARAQSLLHQLSTREERNGRSGHGAVAADSGLRLYNQPTSPPPYTAD